MIALQLDTRAIPHIPFLDMEIWSHVGWIHRKSPLKIQLSWKFILLILTFYLNNLVQITLWPYTNVEFQTIVDENQIRLYYNKMSKWIIQHPKRILENRNPILLNQRSCSILVCCLCEWVYQPWIEGHLCQPCLFDKGRLLNNGNFSELQKAIISKASIISFVTSCPMTVVI